MPYKVQSSEKLRKSGADFETKAMLYLLNFREDSSQINYNNPHGYIFATRECVKGGLL